MVGAAGLLPFFHPDRADFHLQALAALIAAARFDNELPQVRQGIRLGVEHALGAISREILAQISWQDVKLPSINLAGRDMRGLDLRDAFLENAKLTGARLDNADLNNAKLQGAHLEGTSLKNANLVHTDLAGATLENAHLSGANLEGTHSGLMKCRHQVRGRLRKGRVQEPNHRHRRLLRPRRQRPRCRAPKPRDELPPSHLSSPEVDTG